MTLFRFDQRRYGQVMTASKPQTQVDPAFRAILYPHRSLSPRGFLLLMSGIGSVSFVAGMVFWWIGAWPVFGFLGLDVALIYWAFRANYRAARASELIELDQDQLTLTRTDPKGRQIAFAFNPYWVRVELRELTGGQTKLALASHGRLVEFGRFLNHDERREFAGVLKGQLGRVRSGLSPA